MKIRHALLAGAVLGAAVLGVGAATAGPEKVDYPTAYQSRYVWLGDTDRHDNNTIRRLYMNPEAFAAAKSGQPLPDNTILVLEMRSPKMADGKPVLQEGRFVPGDAVVGIAVQQKKRGFGTEYADTLRNGDWEYAVFDINGVRRNAPTQACLTCHKPRSGEDFTFVAWRVIADLKK
jgi:hypothetical protein